MTIESPTSRASTSTRPTLVRASARYVLDADGGQPAGRAVDPAGRRRRDDRAARAAGWTSPARPTCSPSRWTSWTPADAGPDERRARRPALLGDVVLCPAVAAEQAAPAGHSRRRRAAPAAPCTACCTCSATTTPSRTRSGRCSGCRPSCSTGWRARRERAGAAPDAECRHGAGRRHGSADGCVTDRDAAASSRVCWSPLAGLLAGVDAALAAVSPGRAVEELVARGPRAAPARCRGRRRPAPATPTCCCCCGSPAS